MQNFIEFGVNIVNKLTALPKLFTDTNQKFQVFYLKN